MDHQVTRAARHHQIAEGIRAGLTQAEIGALVGTSGPNVCQVIQRDPDLRRLKTTRTRSELDRIHGLRAELRELANDVRRELRRLDNEILAYEVDLAVL
jgi:hypothetical protein